jgi:hypothetical protein
VTYQQLILELGDVLRIGLRTLITRGEEETEAGEVKR